MVLIYKLVCTIAVVLAKFSAWRTARAKTKLENETERFKKVESQCKADEVETGRSSDVASQLRLIKQFEKREVANEHWKRRAIVSAKYRRIANWLSNFSGRKLPYATGLLDMAIGLKMLEAFLGSPVTWELLVQQIAQI